VRGVLDPAREVAGDTAGPGRLFAANHGVERRTDWLVAMRIRQEAPLLGCGAGNYGAMWLGTRAALGAEPRHRGLAMGAPAVTRAHNEYLQWGAETGWIGILWLASMTVVGTLAWGRAWRLATSRQDRRELLLPAAGLGAVAVIALVAFPARLPASGLAMALLLGLLIAAARGPESADPVPTQRRLPRAVALPLLAAAILSAALAVRTFRGDLLLARAQTLFTAGQTAALPWLQRGLALTPWPGDGRLYLGLALATEQRTDEAAVQLEASLRDRPSFEAPLSLAELAIDGARAADAKRWLDLVEACSPPLGFRRQVGYLRAYALLRADSIAEAATGFAALVAADRLDHRSWLGLGYARARLGDRDAAAAAYRGAIAALEESLAAPRPATDAARGEMMRLRGHLEAARRALASVGS
jgi:tetratricopeptide (TPR) repeat protein